MFVCLMPFFALREVGRVIGDDKLYELYFSCDGPSMFGCTRLSDSAPYCCAHARGNQSIFLLEGVNLTASVTVALGTAV
jgi:hypothetical protein